MTAHDKIYNLLSALQRTAAQGGDIALGAAYLAEQKAETLFDTAKLLLRANSLEHDIDRRMQAMGELLYATHRGSPTESEILHQRMEEIDALRAELEELNVRLGRETPRLKCPACGGAVREGDKFCRCCGEEL